MLDVSLLAPNFSSRARSRYPKAARLLRRREFLAVNRKGLYVAGQYLVIQYRFCDANARPRMGLTVSKRYGNAVARNRFKRQIREAFRSCQHELPRTLDLIVKPRAPASEATGAELRQEFGALCLRLVERLGTVE